MASRLTATYIQLRGNSNEEPTSTTFHRCHRCHRCRRCHRRAIATSVAPAALAVEVEGNVTLASDYSFRGWSQTQRDPAIQGGFDVGFESGFYVGTWASNVNFGKTSMEWDLLFGWAGEVSEGVELDVSFIYFDYPNDRDDLNYQELAGSLSFSNFTVGVNYSPDYLAVDDVKFLYPYVGYSHDLTEGVSLDLHVGYNLADSPRRRLLRHPGRVRGLLDELELSARRGHLGHRRIRHRQRRLRAGLRGAAHHLD